MKKAYFSEIIFFAFGVKQFTLQSVRPSSLHKAMENLPKLALVLEMNHVKRCFRKFCVFKKLYISRLITYYISPARNCGSGVGFKEYFVGDGGQNYW